MTNSRTRLRFDGVEVTRHGSRCQVETTFSFGGQTIKTSAEESSQGDGPIRAAAAATLEAIKVTVSNRFSCLLEDLDRVNALGKDLIAVLVNIEFEGRQFQVFGSCQKVSEDEVSAAVKATLNATNRFVELSMRS